jgi:ABC-2 type transport system permease protein
VSLELTFAALRRRRVGLVVRVVTVAALVAVVVAFYPSIKGDASLDKSFADLPDVVRAFLGGDSIVSEVGYLSTRLFGYVVPGLLIGFTVTHGAAAIAGEEEDHRLNLVLAHPVSPRSAVLQRLLAMTVELFVVTLGVLVPLIALSGPSDFHIGIGHETAAVVQAAALALAFGVFALATGAATGNRALALGLGSTLAIVGYVVESMARVVSGLKPLRPFTVWRWYSGNVPLRDGLDVAGTTVLIVLSVIVLVAGLVLFERRDVRE